MPRRKRPNPQSEENIRRIDTKPRAKKQTHGFQVHFLRADRVVTRMFSDNVYGGKQAARRAVRKLKHTTDLQLPPRNVCRRRRGKIDCSNFPAASRAAGF